MLRAFVSDTIEPTGTRTTTQGRWVGEAAWPSPEISTRSLYLGGARELGDAVSDPAILAIRSPQSHGKAGGEWMATGCPGEHPTDQRLDNGGALVFETALLDEDFDVLGAPVARLRIAADCPVAQISLRLNDVLPDARITRVSYQVFNLTHRDCHENPEALEPGKFYDVTIKLNDCGYRFTKGHKLQLAIATAYWPMVWTSPYDATISISVAESALDLPVRAVGDGKQVRFEPPAHGPLTPMTQIDPGTVRRWTEQDHETGVNTYITEGVGGLFGEGVLRFDEINTELSHSLRRELSIRDDDPLSARYVLTQTYEMSRDGWRIKIESRTEMRSDEGSFYLIGELLAFENGRIVKTRQWDERYERDLI